MHQLHLSTTAWFILIGAILLSMGLTAGRMRSLPITTAMCYLSVGILFGPSMLNMYSFNPFENAKLLEVITEIAVILSLFTAGLKIQLSHRSPLWWMPLRLAFVSMTLSVGLVAAFCHWVLELPLGVAVLIGAILAPTDPVLATDVQIKNPRDQDRLRFSLTGEAGLNDGSAFPFVMLGLGLVGLHDLGDFGLRWLWHDVLWGILGAGLIGFLLGSGMAHLVHWLEKQKAETPFMDDFLGLGLIAITYGLALAAETYAFLAVFVAAVALRRTEHIFGCGDDDTTCSVDGMANHSMAFNEQLERISEVLLILLIGGMLTAASWSMDALLIAAFVMLVARPLSVMAGVIGVRVPFRPLALISWFGVRGIGSMYYLMFIITHGLDRPTAHMILDVTLVVVTLSIFLHGMSVTPMMRTYRSRQWEADEPLLRTTDSDNG